jgi:creatinine amidohydrolase/Fe(II)-dependent formamide hydrolase-like protein
LVEKEKPYIAYNASLPHNPNWDNLLETKETGHACEWETSILLHIAPQLVKMHQVPSKPFKSLERNRTISQVGIYSPVDWYSMYPVMYVGDASKASAEKGKALLRHDVQALVEAIKVIKADESTPQLYREFLQKKQNPTIPQEWK